MKRLAFLFTVFFAVLSCSGQEKPNHGISEHQNGEQDTIPRPRESWKVDKEVDENGNVIRMDSTYTWSFSSDGRDMSPETVDSLMNSFRQRLGSGMPAGFGNDFFGSFSSDSAFFAPFSGDSLFIKQMEEHHSMFEEMMRRADSIHRNAGKSFGKMEKI
ncbi:hypothetical protein [Sinomicrobium soli]|uniref:hypothetical protein n=1 Tax=Sinomicrobium sp. N-1-3-6 TaxID=2219864 RepID=UPI000DCEDD13|nr:hypothetical protein [Sinomicrobium sp. N-1-3-6]RAV30487.1 hypothetical protein DN748_03030 [Sinomicrobium sp. N-1-3-6]